MWTHFWDMCSGGGHKEPQGHIFIEAPEAEAVVIFYNRFGHSSERVSCTCCGPDYSVSEYETLELATEWQRKEAWDSNGKKLPTIALEQYVLDPDVLIIYEKDIKPKEREGTVPQQGYVWIN